MDFPATRFSPTTQFPSQSISYAKEGWIGYRRAKSVQLASYILYSISGLTSGYRATVRTSHQECPVMLTTVATLCFILVPLMKPMTHDLKEKKV